MRQSFSYIAGYIDGDGCFFLNKESDPLKYRAKIIISSTNHNTLKSFQSSYKGSIYQVHKSKSHWKNTYHWTIRGKEALFFTFGIFEYLVEKKQDASIFIKYIKESCKLKKEELIKTMRTKREDIREINEEVVQRLRNIKKTKSMTEENYAYLAGFIDAECCLGISKYKPKNRPNFTYKISLQCTNTNPIIFFWLRERLGGTITHVRRNHKNPKHRDQIIWNLNGSLLIPHLPKILVFIRSKKQVCQKLIEFHETVLPNGGDRQSKGFKESYGDILAKRELIVSEIHKLNSKGVKVI